MSDEPDYKALFDILIRALASPEYWVTTSVLSSDSIVMTLMQNKGGQSTRERLRTICGTPEHCVAQLAAIEAEKRLTT